MKPALPPTQRAISAFISSIFPRNTHRPNSYVLRAGAIFCLATNIAYAQESTTQVEETVVIKGKALSSKDKAKGRLESVAGGVGVIDNSQVEKGRSATLEDVLAYEPGVYAQAAGGTDAIKISIRGSGANTSPGYFREGTTFLFDGLALTGSGGTPYELIETSGVNYTEVLRGANAFQYGALSLGGAINFSTHTGYTSPGNYARIEAGSFGWRKQQLSTGGVSGDTDYYVSVTNSERDGYQDFTHTNAKGIVGNIGFRLTPKLETRLIARYREEYHENAATLTLAQLRANPKQTNPTSVAQAADATKEGSTWIGSKTTYTIDDVSKLEFGLVYHDYPQILSKNSSVNPNVWKWRDINASLRYLRSDQLFGHQSDTTVSFSRTQAIDSGVKTYKGQTGILQKDATYTGSSDTVLALGNELQLDKNTWLSSGLSVVNVKRDVNVRYSDRANTTAFPNHYDYSNTSLAPRIGLRYDIQPEIQAFANISRSIDPPSSWSISGSGVTNNYAKTLTEQKANTVEVGLRGKSGIFSGSLSLYRSQIRNELLTVEIVPAVGLTPAVQSTANASPTIHQGIEAGLDARLWKGAGGDNVTLRQAYTYNDFHYRNDALFKKNQLPGLPKHVYQAELQYQAPAGFYAGVNLRAFSNTSVDYANSFHAPGATIFGAKFGYESPSDKWNVFLDLRNLGDKAYATAISPLYDVKGVDSRGLYVGDGFGAFAGVSFRF